ncbi:protein SFI1 homolog isoform X4 [Castor canadensis]|uniref:Protein SFI1 homolog isoform X4 n=1 Tax=Castor canadensis TaxID=51338 RepID=A0AC58LK15_CASCN
MEKKAVDSRSLRDSMVKKPYSQKALPTKKSSNTSGIRRVLPRTTHPVQYVTSRTWTRQGRLRALRLRFYYEQKILRKVFGEWKEEWWVSHREWKLCVRADCHYRYYLYSLMFHTWKAYVRQRQEMRRKHIRAEDHDAKRKMRWAWKSWLIHVVVRRTKLEMQMTAQELRQRSMLWVWWGKWRQQLGEVRVSRALEAIAVKHRTLILQLQAWSRWQEQLLHRQREREKVVSAVRHHQQWQKHRSLKAWLEYLHARRAKTQQNEMAARFHRVTVLQIHFCDWQWAWERRQSLAAQQALVEELARKMVLRRALTHWKHFVLLCAEEAAQCQAAEEHHRLSLLHFCFRALKDNVTRAHFQRIRKNLAHLQHDTTLLRRFWSLWHYRIEQREEREKLPLLHAAWVHYRVTLLRKCVRLWLQYTQKRRHKQLLQATADSHFQQRALSAAFHTWSRLWRQHQQEHVLSAQAVRFHRGTVEKQVFAIWWQKMFQHRENRLAERMAILQAERHLLQRSWSMWHQQAAARRQEQEWQAVACAHHQQGQLRKAFWVWRESARGLRTERTGRARAVCFHSVRLLRWAWSRWRECLALRAAEQQQLMQADLRGQRIALRRALRKWLAYQSRVRSVLQEVAARESQHNRQLLRWVLRRWRQNTVARVDEARKCSEASVHYRRTLCSKVLVRWREVALVQIHCRQREAGALREARKVLDRAPTERQTLACTCLRSSPDLVSALAGLQPEGRPAEGPAGAGSPVSPPAAAAGGCDAVEDTPSGLRQEKAPAEAGHPTPGAETHPDLLLPVETTAGGQEAGAAEHSTGPVVLGVLATGKGKCASSGRSCVRGGKPLPQGVGVMAEVRPHLPPFLEAWTAWLGFVLERRRKKARLEWAVQFYHRQLLQEGATRLLRFAASLKAFRQQLQAQQQMQAVHSLHHVVRRCAEHWKQKALGQGRESRPPAPITPTRRVTFEGPLPNHDAAGAGDATLETKRRRARPQGAPGSLVLPAGEPYLLELNAARSARKQPRRPHFLLESTQSQRSPGYSPLPGQGLEKCQEWGRGIRPAGPSLPRPLLSGAPSAPGPELLLPPSSFTARGAGGLARVSAQPTATGPKLRAPPSLAGGSDPHLLLPGDFTGTRPEHGSAAAGQAELEAELEGIQQQLQRYQSTKYNLWSCQRQASSLRRWLELSQEEPRPEDQDAEQQVQKELDEVELQIQRLAQDLQAQRQPVRACITRVQALRRLCADRGAKADRQPSGRRRDQNTKLP